METQAQIWADNLRQFPEPFPREYGLKRQVLVNKAEYMMSLREQWNRDNCYCAVYAEKQKAEHLVDTLFIEGRDWPEINSLADLNVDMMRRMSENAQSVVKKFYRFGLYPRVLFSGARGFHYYIDFPLTKIKYLRYDAEQLLKDCKIALDDVDMHVVGNMGVMARIPCTINLRTELYCVPVDVFDEPENILRNSALCIATYGYTQPNEDFELQMLGYEEMAVHKKDYSNGNDGHSQPANVDIYPPCFIEIMAKLKKSRYATHDERLHLAAFLRQTGWTEEQVLNLFREYSNDWNERVAGYHVSYAYRNQAKCYTCLKAKKLKFCAVRDQNSCPFFPSINLKMFGIQNGDHLT
jgi:hypothetical protein